MGERAQQLLDAMLIPWAANKTPVFQWAGSGKQEMDFGKKMVGAVLSVLKKNHKYDFLRENPRFERLLRKHDISYEG